MRSRHEIAFRLRQEIWNLAFLISPLKEPQIAPSPIPGLADPRATIEALRGSVFALDVIALAERILQGRIPILGIEIETGAEIRWRFDYVRGIESEPRYFRTIRYLDCAAVGDHKIVWELNRHQHLVLLAQAWRFTGDRRFLDEIVRQLESWFTQNPFQRGINWASALEVAFRVWSWIWIYHFVGNEFEAGFRRRFLGWLWRHGAHLERNLSIYFSPNTHLLGEAVVLHSIGRLFPAFEGAERWQRLGRRIVLEQMAFQVQADGSHFEQSTYYHVYALDMFLWHHILEGGPADYTEKLKGMARYLSALLGPSRKLAFLGDDDGGRFFHPYGQRDGFGRATLASCSVHLREDFGYEAGDLHGQAVWWMGAGVVERRPVLESTRLASKFFENSGMAIFDGGDWHVVVKAGPFGWAGAGHSHSDVLSMTASWRGSEILVDAGTYTYVGEPEWRRWFRGSAAHNTIRVDGRDQAEQAGPFRWVNKPAVRLREWRSDDEFDFLDAECDFGFAHRRRVLFFKPDLICILDTVSGPAGVHGVEQFWHLGDASAREHLIFPGGEKVEWGEAGENGWRSLAYGVRRPGPYLRISRDGSLPAVFAAVLCGGLGSSLRVEVRDAVIRLHWQGRKIDFPESGMPIIMAV